MIDTFIIYSIIWYIIGLYLVILLHKINESDIRVEDIPMIILSSFLGMFLIIIPLLNLYENIKDKVIFKFSKHIRKV